MKHRTSVDGSGPTTTTMLAIAAAITSSLLLSCLLPTAHAGWIDEDTPQHLRTTGSLVDGSTYHLIMSDEFNVPHRSFADGHDPTWTALDKSDDDYSASGGGSLHFYNSSTVTTTPDGMLTIQSILEKTSWTHYDTLKKQYKQETKYFKSGMVQSWDKFCFTGGILEVDVILPGEPDIGGLWPAIWLLGNLGRATYEVSTNNLWPWSYDDCDRNKQESQVISACNKVNHFGLNPQQGRGATEIDVLELMGGDSGGKALPATSPPIRLPYVDMTLQVAPGIPDNRPQSGSQPVRTIDTTTSGYATSQAQSWYDHLTVAGNTSLNPFFYGTYLGPTKPNEPVTRNANQAFQADAVGAMKQIVSEHFKSPHTFRVEWQPGRGGRLDWFTKSYKMKDSNGTMFHMEGDGKGQDWEHSLSIPDYALEEAMGSKIPEEPSYIIFNTAISSTWAFPYSLPDWCPKCYDCHDPKCTCSFNPGFCNMMKTGKVALKIDSVRVYQSRNDDAHSGKPHSVGCDPVDFPTREYIKGYQYRYMRNPPFVYDDKLPLRSVKMGGGVCEVDEDCGGGRGGEGVEGNDAGQDNVETTPSKAINESSSNSSSTSAAAEEDIIDLDNDEKDEIEVAQPSVRRLIDDKGWDGTSTDKLKGSELNKPPVSEESVVDCTNESDASTTTAPNRQPKGRCVKATAGVFGPPSPTGKQCQCNVGYTGPHCLSIDKFDDEPGAFELKKVSTLFTNRAKPYLTKYHIVFGVTLASAFMVALVVGTLIKGKRKSGMLELMPLQS